ncbi:magnesium-dependent phosphatase-1 [Thelephora ganbajun]|uniref:Magnesium-dependent phosphatase-1 n=1 Tax=Thelephora ganbajun TaxID=370292 RepID=A0ACB6ZVB4_THEGA|nr:magnesium-dependent phosphatase-1 [Thelephora ganbajun]
MANRMPKLIAFDLDYTLWDLWIDTHVSEPLRRDGNKTNQVLDRCNNEICFYQDVPQILHRLRGEGVFVAACSRTCAASMARRALSLLLVPAKDGDERGAPVAAEKMFDQMEIYPGSKKAHFRKLHEATGISYSEMLFFDDEIRNKEVESLGVTFCLVPDGVDAQAFEKGLREWRRRHSE